MLTCQKSLFRLPPDITYLNCAYMSPLMKSVLDAGAIGMQRKANPASIKPEDFFNEAEDLAASAANLINAKPRQIAIVPSASYGIKSVVNNLPTHNGTHAVMVKDEFPSGYYTVESWCKINDKELKIIGPPASFSDRGKKWNERLLESINRDTAVVMISSIHWTDGTRFDLKSIGERCRETDTLFIVDGTQSTGALPMDVIDNKIHALVCAGYKWLLGPYSIGFAYFNEFFNDGVPLEDTWMNKTNAVNFNRLDYVDEYKTGASRYNVGEYSNFTLVPMLNSALKQIMEWQVDEIQKYCGRLTKPLVEFIRERGLWIEDAEYRTNHLFGVGLPEKSDPEKLLQQLQDRKIYVSLRGDAVRISPHLYNTEQDIETLIDALGAL